MLDMCVLETFGTDFGRLLCTSFRINRLPRLLTGMLRDRQHVLGIVPYLTSNLIKHAKPVPTSSPRPGRPPAYRLLTKNPAFFAAGLPRPIKASLAFRDCLPSLGASLTSLCLLMTRYTVVPTRWSAGCRASALATCRAAVLKVAFPRRARLSSSSSLSSFSSELPLPSCEAASRKSSGRTAGRLCLSSLLRVGAGAERLCARGWAGVSSSSDGDAAAAFAVAFTVAFASAAACFSACFLRASACSLKRASRSWRLRFWSSCCLRRGGWWVSDASRLSMTVDYPMGVSLSFSAYFSTALVAACADLAACAAAACVETASGASSSLSLSLSPPSSSSSSSSTSSLG